MTEFTTESIFEALKAPLGMIDDPERRRQLEGYVEAARSALDRAVYDLLSKFAETVNGEVSAHYEVTLHYRPGVLDLDVRAREAAEADEEMWLFSDGDVEKITLRIPAELKELAAEAAAKGTLSVNSWFVRMLARALRSVEGPLSEAEEHHRGGRRRGRAGRRLTGWVGPDS